MLHRISTLAKPYLLCAAHTADKTQLDVDLSDPSNLCACPRCKTVGASKRLLCDSCHADKLSRTGRVYVDPMAYKFRIAERIKAAVSDQAEGRGIGRQDTVARPADVSVFNAIHADINVYQPSYRHISPIYEIRSGLARGYHAWEFRVMSGEVLTELLECAFRERGEAS